MERYQLILVEKDNFPITRMCSWIEVSESGFYAWLRREPSAQQRWRRKLAAQVRRVFEDSNGIYGYRKVHRQLRDEGVEVCAVTVRGVMLELGLKSCHPAPWRYLTESDGSPPAPDLIGRDFTAVEPGVRLCGDITQIDTWEGPLYLATVIDLYNREVIGYAMDDNYRAELVCAGVRMAVGNRRVRKGAVFHSDRGSQYTSGDFKKCLKAANMLGSMGRVGSCFDNAVSEAWFATLKKELVYRTVFVTRDQAMLAVRNFIEVWYNRRRLHSVVGYRSPAAVREEFELLAVA